MDEHGKGHNLRDVLNLLEDLRNDGGRLTETLEGMRASLELMRKASYEVELSDEGMMTAEIVECLQVVIPGLDKTELPRDELANWCTAMLRADRVEFLCDRELRALREKLSPPR
jgi:hypothetical protein